MFDYTGWYNRFSMKIVTLPQSKTVFETALILQQAPGAEGWLTPAWWQMTEQLTVEPEPSMARFLEWWERLLTELQELLQAEDQRVGQASPAFLSAWLAVLDGGFEIWSDLTDQLDLSESEKIDLYHKFAKLYAQLAGLRDQGFDRLYQFESSEAELNQQTSDLIAQLLAANAEQD